jgi:signal transduction histidine kinase
MVGARIARVPGPFAAQAARGLVDLLVRDADPRLRDRLLLEVCLQISGAACGAVWRREPGTEWRPLLERGTRGEVPGPEAVRAALSGARGTCPPGCAVACAAAGGRGLAVAIGGARAQDGEVETLEGLLAAVLLLEAADPAAGAAPHAPLPAERGSLRRLEHDVRNALTSLQATQQVLDLMGGELDPAESARFRAAVERECARTGALLARGLAPQAARAAQAAHAAEVVRDVLATEAGRLREAGVEVRLRVAAQAEGLPAAPTPEDFGRVVRNLVVNAREALEQGARPGGRLELELWTEATPAGPVLGLRVEDHGAELPDVALHELLRPGCTFGKAWGSGLGLAAVREVVQRAGGCLSVERLRGGARFEARLAAPKGAAVSGNPEKNSGSELHSGPSRA